MQENFNCFFPHLCWLLFLWYQKDNCLSLLFPWHNNYVTIISFPFVVYYVFFYSSVMSWLMSCIFKDKLISGTKQDTHHSSWITPSMRIRETRSKFFCKGVMHVSIIQETLREMEAEAWSCFHRRPVLLFPKLLHQSEAGHRPTLHLVVCKYRGYI